MSATTQTTVGDVVGGKHPEGTVVTVTGIANTFDWRKTKQGNTWATFRLLTPTTSVDAFLYPARYAEFGDGMGPTLADYRPQQVTVTGRVVAGTRCQPAIVVTGVKRHTDGACESLETMRRQSEHVNALIRDGLLPEPQPACTDPGEGVGIREVIARLRGEPGSEATR